MSSRRYVLAFYPDIRNIPKKEDVRLRKLMNERVQISVLDIDYHEHLAKKYKVTEAPCFVVMQRPPGFNDGMFKEPYEVRRTNKLEDIEKWADWLRGARPPRI